LIKLLLDVHLNIRKTRKSLLKFNREIKFLKSNQGKLIYKFTNFEEIKNLIRMQIIGIKCLYNQHVSQRKIKIGNLFLNLDYGCLLV